MLSSKLYKKGAIKRRQIFPVLNQEELHLTPNRPCPLLADSEALLEIIDWDVRCLVRLIIRITAVHIRIFNIGFCTTS